jgi:hypothetical protein
VRNSNSIIREINMSFNFELEQRVICNKYEASYFPAEDYLKLGIATIVKEGIVPINSLRTFPSEGLLVGLYGQEKNFQKILIFLPLFI